MNNDLTKRPPRSPKAIISGFAILGRTLDKCRAAIAGKLGEYDFDCELDRFLFDFKGITAQEFMVFVKEGHTDEEVGEWVRSHGITKTDSEIKKWTSDMINFNYSGDKEGEEWLQAQNIKYSLLKDGTLFDYLEADDKASFKI